MRTTFGWALALVACASASAWAQERGSVNPKPLPPLANPDSPTTPAKELFARRPLPANMAARSIGFYSRGCLAGGVALPVDGDSWQVMRLSRNRNWGHPEMVRTVERIARQAKAEGVWPGLLVGDISQPRGGPMLTGHASHQIGLDADIWLTPMPTRTLNRAEREEMSATDMVRADRRDIDPRNWTPAHVQILRIAAQQPNVERVLVNAAIKKAVLPRGEGRPSLAVKDKAVLGAQLPFPRSDHVSCKRSRLPPTGARAPGRGLRFLARLVVHGRGSQPKADAKRETEAADHHGATA